MVEEPNAVTIPALWAVSQLRGERASILGAWPGSLDGPAELSTADAAGQRARSTKV